MTIAFYALLAWFGWISPEHIRKAWEVPAADPALLLGVLLILAELALLTALALFFSTFSSSALTSLVLTAGLWVAGLEGQDLRHFGDLVDSPATPLVSAIGWIVPAFSAFDLKGDIVHGHLIPAGLVAWRLGYAALYELSCSALRCSCFRAGNSSEPAHQGSAGTPCDRRGSWIVGRGTACGGRSISRRAEDGASVVPAIAGRGATPRPFLRRPRRGCLLDSHNSALRPRS